MFVVLVCCCFCFFDTFARAFWLINAILAVFGIIVSEHGTQVDLLFFPILALPFWRFHGNGRSCCMRSWPIAPLHGPVIYFDLASSSERLFGIANSKIRFQRKLSTICLWRWQFCWLPSFLSTLPFFQRACVRRGGECRGDFDEHEPRNQNAPIAWLV